SLVQAAPIPIHNAQEQNPLQQRLLSEIVKSHRPNHLRFSIVFLNSSQKLQLADPFFALPAQLQHATRPSRLPHLQAGARPQQASCAHLQNQAANAALLAELQPNLAAFLSASKLSPKCKALRRNPASRELQREALPPHRPIHLAATVSLQAC